MKLNEQQQQHIYYLAVEFVMTWKFKQSAVAVAVAVCVAVGIAGAFGRAKEPATESYFFLFGIRLEL